MIQFSAMMVSFYQTGVPQGSVNCLQKIEPKGILAGDCITYRKRYDSFTKRVEWKWLEIEEFNYLFALVYKDRLIYCRAACGD